MRSLLAALLLVVAPLDCTMTAILKPLGLITQPNPFGQYPPGALHTAQNVAMRDPGVLQSFPALRDYRAAIGTGRCYKAFPHDSSVLTFSQHTAVLTWTPRWVTPGASTTITMPSGFTFSADAGKLRASTIAGRTIVTNAVHLLSIDGESATAARRVGVPPPRALADAVTASGQALEDGKVTNYRAYIERSVTIGTATTVLIGAVSSQTQRSNSSGGTVNVQVNVEWPSNTGVTAGDKIRLWKTKSVAVGSEPGDTMFLTATYTITSTDISNSEANVLDVTPDASLGEELYTNPGQQTINESNWVPPLADDIETFGGYTFYASRRLQNQIYLKVPGGWGTLSSVAERTYGVGSRQITADTHSDTNVDNISATHMLGLVVGQYISGPGIPTDATITAIGASSVTISAAATATAAGVTLNVYDRIDIDGTVYGNRSWSYLHSQLRFLQYMVYSDKPTHDTISDNDLGATVLLSRYYGGQAQMSLRATNGANFSPQLPILADTAYSVPWDEKANRISWSKKSQPEAVPTLNHDALVGNGTVYRMIAVSDRMYIFCSDGLYELTGSDGVWRVELKDSTLVLAARDAADKIGDVVYAYTNKGLVSVSTAGVVELSSGVFGAANPSDTYGTGSLPGAAYTDSWDVTVTCDELHSEAWLRLSAGEELFVWNAKTEAFTKFVDDSIARTIAYSRALRSLVIANGSSNNSTLQYFELDTSTSRKDEAIIVFQPMYFGNPTQEKEFLNVDWMFVGAGNSITAGASFNRVYFNNVTVPASTVESHAIVDVPRNAPSVSTTIQPGLEMSTGSDTTAWKLVAIDVAYRPIGTRANR